MKKLHINFWVLQEEHPLLKKQLERINEHTFGFINKMLRDMSEGKVHFGFKDEEKNKLIPFADMSFNVYSELSAVELLQIIVTIEREYKKAFELSVLVYNFHTEDGEIPDTLETSGHPISLPFSKPFKSDIFD